MERPGTLRPAVTWTTPDGRIPVNPDYEEPSFARRDRYSDAYAYGAGAGQEALGLGSQSDEDLRQMLPYLPVLEFMANQPGASWAMRNTLRKVKTLR